MKIPDGVQGLTAEWLTAALHERGSVNQARVTTFEIEIKGDVAGGASELAHLRLTYDTNEAGAPPSLWAKLSPSDPAHRADLNALNFYQREIWFFEEIASQAVLRTPQCYYSDMNSETGETCPAVRGSGPIRGWR